MKLIILLVLCGFMFGLIFFLQSQRRKNGLIQNDRDRLDDIDIITTGYDSEEDL